MKPDLIHPSSSSFIPHPYVLPAFSNAVRTHTLLFETLREHEHPLSLIPYPPMDPTIREQTYRYFVQEAPELLHALEHGLQGFKSDRSINQVHTLLRATHTLKGAATSVGLETIATVAHSLEDIFKALCQPDLVIDAEVEALLFEGVECLRLPLVAELTGRSVNHSEILDRTAAVFAQLQEKLGDCFDPNTQLPTSQELGFDVTQSIFEVGVAQRLEQLAAALDRHSPQEISPLLRTQAEVFLGIAESLNLPGFGAIAQATIAALNRYPDQALAIAQQAVADFWEGQAAVLAGDRNQGGQPSLPLQQWSDLTTSSLADSSNQAFGDLLENIWGDSSMPEAMSEAIPEAIPDVLGDEFDALEPIGEIVAMDEDLLADHASVLPSPVTTPMPFVPKDLSAPPAIVRVNLKHLDHLNYSVGELLTQQNRQMLQTEQLQASVRTLLGRLKRHQQILQQLQQATDRPPLNPEAQRKKGKKQRTSHPKSKTQVDRDRAQTSSPKSKIPLPDRNSDRIQFLLDDMVQLTEAADAIDLFTHQSTQTQEKQHQLLTQTRNALIEVRMMPLGEVLGRFSQVLQQLETLHNKPVALSLQGAEVLIDKAIAEKLYDPLLHLVRNAFDHGIEPIALRQQRGKAERGQIKIAAYHQNRYLMIEVRDDGKGLDFDQIRHRVVTQRRISAEQAARLDQTQLIEFLFEPGFTTVAQVNDLSGRGIGLDVVRSQLKALRGSVSIQTELYHGTTFTLQIPLSLTVASLLVCESGGQTYTLLDDAIEQIVMPLSTQLQERQGCRTLQWHQGTQEQLVPIYPLTDLLSYGAVVYPPLSAQPHVRQDQEPVKPIILMRCPDACLGLEVDRLLGEQELVIRQLGSVIESPHYVHGASILADGRLALVLDGAILVQTLFQDLQNSANNRWGSPLSPLLLPDSQPPLLPEQALTPPALASAKPDTRILVVEDSITTRQALVLTLQKAGYQVFQAQDGQEAIAQLQQQSQVRLVICDIEMSGMNGFEFLRHAQQTPEIAQIPILMLTSRSDQKHRTLAAQLGATAYMTKPYIEHKLLAVVAELLEQTLLNFGF